MKGTLFSSLFSERVISQKNVGMKEKVGSRVSHFFIHKQSISQFSFLCADIFVSPFVWSRLSFQDCNRFFPSNYEKCTTVTNTLDFLQKTLKCDLKFRKSSVRSRDNVQHLVSGSKKITGPKPPHNLADDHQG